MAHVGVDVVFENECGFYSSGVRILGGLVAASTSVKECIL